MPTPDASTITKCVGRAQPHTAPAESKLREVVDLLPAAIYTTDARGLLTYFNPACEEFSGRKPRLGTDHWCVSWKMYHPDGTPMPHEECPMAIALREGRPVRGEQAIAERPDGTRIWFEPYPTPIRDPDGRIVGGVNMLIDITERKQVEIALRKSQRDLADFFDNAAMALHWVDADGIILRANQAELDLLGYGVEEYVGHHISEFHADQELIDDILRRLHKGETLSRYEARLRCKDGSFKDVLFYSNGLWENGRFVHSRCFTRDITEQKQAERDRALLLQREQEARREAEALNDVARAVFGLDLESVVQKATDAATDLTGAKFGAFFYNMTDAKGETYQLYALSGAPRAAFDKFGMPRNTPLFAHTFRGEGTVRIGDVLRDPRYGKNPPHAGMPPGHLPVRSYLAVPAVSSSGKVLGGMFFGHPEADVFSEQAERVATGIAVHAAIAIDNARLFSDAQQEISERKKIEQELRERERQFASIFDQMTSGFAHTDLSGRFMVANDRFCQLVGRSREELLNLRLQDLTHPDDQKDNLSRFRELVEGGGRNYVIEKRYLRPDGSWVWVHKEVAAIRDDSGNANYIAVTVTDITERKRAEDRLRLGAEELSRFNRAAVGRELRMIDLKKEINELCELLGKAPRYPLQFESETDMADG